MPKIPVEFEAVGENTTEIITVASAAVEADDDVPLENVESTQDRPFPAPDVRVEIVDVKWSPLSDKHGVSPSGGLFSPAAEPSAWTAAHGGGPASESLGQLRGEGAGVLDGAQLNEEDDDGRHIYGHVTDLLLLDAVYRDGASTDDKKALEDYYYEHDVEPGFWDEADLYNDVDDDFFDSGKNVAAGDGLSQAELAIEAETSREFVDVGDEDAGYERRRGENADPDVSKERNAALRLEAREAK